MGDSVECGGEAKNEEPGWQGRHLPHHTGQPAARVVGFLFFYFFSSTWLSVAEVLWNFPLPVLAGHQGEERTLHATFGK